jgi:hypothetical protein
MKIKALFHENIRDIGTPVIIIGNHHELMIFYYTEFKKSELYMADLHHFTIIVNDN